MRRFHWQEALAFKNVKKMNKKARTLKNLLCLLLLNQYTGLGILTLFFTLQIKNSNQQPPELRPPLVHDLLKHCG